VPPVSFILALSKPSNYPAIKFTFAISSNVVLRETEIPNPMK